VKYTYNGDANADGQLNADDYAAIDAGFATHSTGYGNGDFNYSGGGPNSDDYFVIDLAYSNQDTSLSSVPQTASDKTIDESRSVAVKRPRHRHHHRKPKIRATVLFSRQF
jgi:hypothetical protein